MTDTELDALVRDAVLSADCLQETGTFETGQAVLHACACAIRTLRADLAEARAERDAMIHPDHVDGLIRLAEPMLYEALAAETARADRAEAALAEAKKDSDAVIASLSQQLSEVRAGYRAESDAYDVAAQKLVASVIRARRAEAQLAAQIYVDAGIAYETAHNTNDISKIRDSILAQPHDRTALNMMLQAARKKAILDAASMFDADSNIAQTILALIDNASPTKAGGE